MNSQQTLDLYRPTHSADQLTPLVVYIHGGGWRHGDKTDPIVRYYGPNLVHAGFAFAAINYRLSPQYIYPNQNDDVACALTYLQTNAAKYHLDPQRIVLFGDSAGGELAAYAAVSPRYQDAVWRRSVRGVIDFYGVSDFTTLIDGSHLDRSARTYLGPNYRQLAATASPIGTARISPPPFLLIHGINDQVVPLAQSQSLEKFLRDQGGQATLVSVRGAGHGFGLQGSPSASTQITQFATSVVK